MSPLQIKLAIYALMAIIVTGAYFGWAYHQQQIGYEKAAKEVALRDADTARQSAELMATEKAKVEKSNNELNERLHNAITIYSDHTRNLNDDVANLTNRMLNDRTPAICCNFLLFGTSDDNGKGKERDREADTDIARAAIELANLCELQINKLQVIK